MNPPRNDHPDLDGAYLLLRDMSTQDEYSDPTGPERVAGLVAAQDEPEPILRGLGAVINQFVEYVDAAYRIAPTADVEGPVRDVLHVFQPAIIARLAKTPGIDRSAVPLIAGALTAASLGFDCYEWRSSVGTWKRPEYAAWAYATRYLCDMVEYVSGQPGVALDMIGFEGDNPLG